MKTLKVFRPLVAGLIVLTLAQLACLAGAQLSGGNTSQNNTPPPAPTRTSSGPSTTPSASATKSERGTPAEAQAMLQLAVQHYQSVGRAQALADFTAGKPPFKDRDLYVACIDSHLVQSANGGFPNLVGSSVQPLSMAAWDAASTSSVSSINYSYLNPVTGATEPKTLYYEKVGTDVCGVGAYDP
ncbi:MAG TPA: hypothetical protein VLX61_12635 [Anaerolineales bacterium]|nr:hypothetical protein [Anaerolineales bacterium]